MLLLLHLSILTHILTGGSKGFFIEKEREIISKRDTERERESECERVSESESEREWIVKFFGREILSTGEEV